MNSKIQDIIPCYSKFENILPDELIHVDISEELASSENEMNKIIDEDLKNIKNLASRQNKAISFNQFTKPSSIIKMAFYMEDNDQNDTLQDKTSFYYAHWMMSLSLYNLSLTM